MSVFRNSSVSKLVIIASLPLSLFTISGIMAIMSLSGWGYFLFAGVVVTGSLHYDECECEIENE